MRASPRLLLGLLPFAVTTVACGNLAKKLSGDEDSPKGATSATSSAAPPTATTESPTTARTTGATIAGIGDVPPWSPDHGTTEKCTTSAAAQTKIKAFDRGDDPQIISGNANLPALSREVGADACFATRKALAESLNNGGYKLYGAKKFEDASRFWRASLVVRPGNLLARYNLACGLALAGKPSDAVNQIVEISRASKEGDATAINFIEKAKSDGDLKTVRDDPTFKKALEGATGGPLVGPRKGASEPEIGAKAIPQLPEEFRKVKDRAGVSANGFVTFKPAVVNIWTWKPDASSELVVTTITDDPALLGKPRGDLSQGYGGLAVFKRDGEKLTLLVARKTGEAPPAVAAGKNNTVAYTFEQACGSLSGTLAFAGGKVDVREKTCQDLGAEPPPPAAKAAGTPAKGKCKPGEIVAADECVVKCDPDKPKCPAGKKCDVARFRDETGQMQVENICQ